LFFIEGGEKSRHDLRYKGVYILVMGLVAASVIVPRFEPARGSKRQLNYYEVDSALFKTALSCLFLGVVCGIGIGLFIASFINLEPKKNKET